MTQKELAIVLQINAQTGQGKAALKEISHLMNGLSADAQQASGGLSKAFKSADRSVTNFSSSAAAQLGMGGFLGTIVGGVGASVKKLATFDDVMADVRKTTGMSATQIDDLGMSLREMATVDLQGLVGADALGGIAAQAGQLGIQGADNIESFSLAIGEMTVATDLGAKEAATGMAEIENVFRKGLEAAGQTAESQTANIGSAFNALSNTTSATVGEIMDMTRRMGGAAETIGLTVDEVAAISATLKSVGVDVEVGGTAMSKFFLQLLTDSGSFANALKIDAGEIATALKTDPMDAIQMVLEGMDDLKETEGPAALAATLEDLGIKDTRLVDAMLKLSGATEQLETNVGNSNTAFTSATSLHDEFVTKAESTVSQWQGIGEKANEAMRGLGQELKPATELLTDWASGGLDVVLGAAQSWRGGVRDEFFDGLVEEFNLAGLSDSISGVTGDALGSFAEMYDGISSGQITFDDFSAALTGITWADFEAGVDGAIERGQALWTETQALPGRIGAALSGMGDTLAQPFLDGYEEISETGDALWESLKAVPGEVVAAWDNVGADIAAQFQTATDAAADFFNGMQNDTVTGIFETLTDKIYGVDEAEQALTDSVDTTTDAVTRLADIAYGNSTYPDMTSAIIETRGASATLTAEIADSTAKVQDLGTTYEATQRRIEAKEQAVRGVTAQIGQYQAAADSAYGLERDKLETTVKSLKTKKSAMQSDLSAIKKTASAQKSAYSEARKDLAAQERSQQSMSKALQATQADADEWAMAYAQSALSVSYAADNARKKVDADLKAMGEAGQAWAMKYAQHALAVSYANEETGQSFGALAQEALGAFGAIEGSLGGLSGSVGSLGDLLGFDTSGITGLLGEMQGYAQIPGILSDIGGAAGGLLDGLGGLTGMLGEGGVTGLLGGLGDVAGSLLGGSGLGGLGSMLGGLTGSLGGLAGGLGGAIGGLGGLAAAALPVLGPVALVGGAVWGLVSIFQDCESQGHKSAEAMRDFVAANIEGGDEMAAAMSTSYDDMKAAGFDYQTFLQQTETTMDQTFGGISANWEQGATSMDIFTQAVGAATGDMQKAPQVALQMMASFQDMGMSAQEAGAQMLQIAEASGMSSEQVEVLRESLQGVSDDLTGTGDEGESTTTVFDTATEAAGGLQDQTDSLSGSLDGVTGQLSGTGAEGRSTTAVFDKATGAEKVLQGQTESLSGSLSGVTGQLSGTGAEGANTSAIFDKASGAARGLQGQTEGLSGSVSALTHQMTSTGVEALGTSNMFDVAGGAAGGLRGDMSALGGQAGRVRGDLNAVQSALASIPSNKDVTIRFRQDGKIPSFATGGIASGLAIVNEQGSEIAAFPGGSMALMTTPGPVLGAFPAGTEIIPHSRSMALLRDNPHIPRMASGGTIDAMTTGGTTVNISMTNYFTLSGSGLDSAELERLTDEMSRRLAAKIRSEL